MTLLNGNYHTAEDLIPDRVQREEIGIPDLPLAVQHDPQLAAIASPWLDAYIDYSRIWSPRAHDDFHESVGLWALSTIAARRVAISLGKIRYTSLYIALASRTSVFAKSTTAEIAQSILQAAGLSHMLAPDDATPQAFVKSMTHALPQGWFDLSKDQKEERERRLAFAAQRGWFFDEFGMKISSMMREGGFMSEFRSLLRKFDDTPDEYNYETISRGSDNVKAPYLALLANLTPADLAPYAKRGSALWNDGFWARFAFLTPPLGAPRRNERFPKGKRIMPNNLVVPLVEWHRRLGIPAVNIIDRNSGYEAIVSPADPKILTMGDDVYDAYYGYNDALIDIVTSSALTDLDGNYSRLPEKALRVAMLLASLEGSAGIQLKHWHRAQQIGEVWRRNLHHLYDQITNETETPKLIAMEDKIMSVIAGAGPLTIREMVQSVRGLDTGQARILVKSMTETGFLAQMKDGRTERYRLEVED